MLNWWQESFFKSPCLALSSHIFLIVRFHYFLVQCTWWAEWKTLPLGGHWKTHGTDAKCLEQFLPPAGCLEPRWKFLKIFHRYILSILNVFLPMDGSNYKRILANTSIFLVPWLCFNRPHQGKHARSKANLSKASHLKAKRLWCCESRIQHCKRISVTSSVVTIKISPPFFIQRMSFSFNEACFL